jgi:hypothetical protein
MEIVTRRDLRYEITNINYLNDQLRITGWGFAYMQQHFINSSTHDIFVQFENEVQASRHQATLLPIDQTQLLRYGSSSRCKDNVYYQLAMTCYYDYANVGFTVSVPLSIFQLNRNYTTYLIIHAKKIDKYLKIPIYFPLNEPIKTKVNDIEYASISNLKDTELTIISAHVYARSGTSTSYPIYSVGSNCSTAYLNRAYFKENTMYKNVYERYFDGVNTYYRVSANPSTCYLSRRRIVEGTLLTPVWIVSSYVQYSGTPLVITSRLINSAPWFEIQHPLITVGDSFNYKDYISAYDLEEGELSEKIAVISNPFTNKAGVYSIIFEVSDKYGYKTSGIMNVTVVEPSNLPPTIIANNKSIYRFTAFDAYEDVYAFDIEDGNISDRLSVSGEVDTSIVKENIVCYNVTDSHGALARKCIIVNVITNHNKKIRFISYNAKNTAKYPWQYLINTMNRELLNSIPYLTKIINN